MTRRKPYWSRFKREYREGLDRSSARDRLSPWFGLALVVCALGWARKTQA